MLSASVMSCSSATQSNREGVRRRQSINQRSAWDWSARFEIPNFFSDDERGNPKRADAQRDYREARGNPQGSKNELRRLGQLKSLHAAGNDQPFAMTPQPCAMTPMQR